MAIDPYRVLGLDPTASQADIKRAYRRLAKAFHPDSAGESALPAFLAIQDAYTQLTGDDRWRARQGQAAAGGAASAGGRARNAPPREPWRADPVRARAAREQARARAGRSGATGPAAPGSSGPTRPAGRPGPDASPGAAEGSTGTGSGSERRSRTGTGGSGRRRASRKATMGSTSYDEARDPADPRWAGASWYGPTTGEYWIVNPREYADPRKHGPGYLGSRPAAARRPLEVPEADLDEPLEAADEDTVEDTIDGASRREGGGAARGPMADAAAADRHAPPVGPAWQQPREPWSDVPGDREGQSPDAARGAPGGIGEALSAALASSPLDPARRLGLVLLAWPPLGLLVASAIGDATGCSTYAATCDQADSLLPWLAQALILGILLLVPPIARVFAMGSVALLVALVPVTAILIVLGGGRSPQGPAVLAVLVFVAWTIGLLYGLRQTLRRRPPAARAP